LSNHKIFIEEKSSVLSNPFSLYKIVCSSSRIFSNIFPHYLHDKVGYENIFENLEIFLLTYSTRVEYILIS